MQIEDLGKYSIPEKYIQKFKEENIKELYPPQSEVIKKGLFRDKNLILSIPTAGGKTFIATVAMLHKLLENKHTKIVYIVPLVAIAYEKYNYFKKFFDKEFKVAISVGDYDSSDSWLADYDIICVTTEKLDSLLRYNVGWIEKISLIIVDEIHLLNDQSRGPTLEILLTKLMKILPKSQIFGLSATINNAKELAKWVNGDLVSSDFRPVKLYEGVSFDSKIHFEEKEGYELDDSEVENAIIKNTLELGKQILVFTSTRKNAESLAERLSKTVKSSLTENENKELRKLSNEIEHVLESPTQQCKKLATCIKSGVAFHHAGLLGKQKGMIEENFKNSLIKTIVATPTLAMGVNLPAFRVLIRDAKRYNHGYESSYITVLEYKQFVGRAGRPTYDSFGESILLAKSEGDAKDLIRHFILGQPEDITSKLSLEPMLRMHLLALVASNFCNSEKSISDFFNKTFYAHQYGDIEELKEKLNEILKQLEIWEFITRRKTELIATLIGKRISELYLDPLTAFEFLSALKNKDKKQPSEFSYLHTISNSLEMSPLLTVRAPEILDMNELILKRYKHILQDVPEEYDTEFEDFLKSIKTALMFENWVNESTEEQLLMKFRVAPGELYGKLQLADWLIYALYELSLLSGYKEILLPLRKLRIRLKYGIRDELIPLVKLKGIGRIRARKLFRAGLDTIEKLRKVSSEKLSQVIGVQIANEIKKQLGETKAEQSTLQN